MTEISTISQNMTIAFISRLSKSQQDVWLSKLAKTLPNFTVIAVDQLTDLEKQTCQVAIVANPDVEDLMSLPKLKWVQSVWAGVDGIVSYMAKNGITPRFQLSRLIDPNLAVTMSESVLLWCLYLHRDMHVYQAQQKLKQWQQIQFKFPQETHIGILGLGELGKVSAVRLRQNGFKVSGWSKSAKTIEGINCYAGEQGLYELAASSDILLCLLPLTQQTAGIVNETLLNTLPEGAALINFARGGLIDHSALVNSLDNGKLSHAVLDVFEQEPLPSEAPFWQHPNITVLPHISAPTHPDTAVNIVAQNVSQYAESGALPPCISFKLGY